MAKDLNSLSLIGRLTRDGELSYTQSGTAMLKCSLAFSRSIKKGDNWESKSCFIEFTLWGKRADSLSAYLLKGQQIAIEGELDFDTWENEGVKRSKHKIAVNNLQLLGGKRDNQNQQPAGTSTNPSNSYPTPPGEETFEDDLPF